MADQAHKCMKNQFTLRRWFIECEKRPEWEFLFATARAESEIQSCH